MSFLNNEMNWTFFPCSFAFPCCRPVMLSRLTSSGQSTDVRLGSERRTDGLQSALSHGWMGCRWIRPDSEHAALEVSLWKVRVTESTKHTFVLLFQPTEATKKQKTGALSHHGPAFRTCVSLLIPCPFSMSLFISLSLSIVWVNWESNRITAWQFLPVLWVLITTFIFLFFGKEKIKKNIKHKEITVPTKIILTYQESCRTSYTSFYCITVSI